MAILDRLLTLLSEGRTYTPEEAAKELNTTPEMIKAMLAQLEHMGYVSSCKPGSPACSSCPFAGTCKPGHIWSSAGKPTKATD